MASRVVGDVPTPTPVAAMPTPSLVAAMTRPAQEKGMFGPPEDPHMYSLLEESLGLRVQSHPITAQHCLAPP